MVSLMTTKNDEEKYDDDCLLSATASDLEKLGLKIGDQKILLATIKDFVSKKEMEEQLADKYNHKDFKNFYRIDRTLLSLDECYINLTVVSKKDLEGDSIRPWDSYGLVGSGNKKKIFIELKHLFDNYEPNEPSNWEIVDNKRILIFGKAGVGKTTLCKKIVYDYYKKNAWKNYFHRVIWIALRDLKQIAKPEGKVYAELSDVYTHRFFNRKEDGIALSDAITEEEKENKKILFILDGWDEIGELLTDGHWMKNVLVDQLLMKPFLIVTSRPYTMGLGSIPFNMILETIGFTRENIIKYIKTVIPGDSDIQNQVLKFVNSHSTISEMASIPIQLDMICYLCRNIEDLEKCLNTETATMTKLYDFLVKKMMDINQMRKSGSLTSQCINYTYRNIFSNRNNSENCTQLKFLVEVAYNAFLANQIEFSDDFFPNVKMYSVEIRDKVKESYFLNCLNPTESAPEKKSYTYIHLTFQEFLAALHIVHAMGKDELAGLVSKYKYNPRFKIIWSFVAGLIEDVAELDLYFNYLERSPVEITGIFHQLLMISCINECEGVLNEKRMTRLLEDLWNWLPSNKKAVLSVQLPKKFYEKLLASVIGIEKETMRTSERYLNSKWLPDSIIVEVIDKLQTSGFSSDSNEQVTKKLQNILSYEKRFISNSITERIEVFLNGVIIHLNEFSSLKYRETLKTTKMLIDLLVDCELKDSLCKTLLNLFEVVSTHFAKFDTKSNEAILKAISAVLGNSRSEYKDKLIQRLTEFSSMQNNPKILNVAKNCWLAIKIPQAEQINSTELGYISEEAIQSLEDEYALQMKNSPDDKAKRYSLIVLQRELKNKTNLSENTLNQIFDVFQSTDKPDLKRDIMHLFMRQSEIPELIADQLVADWKFDELLLYLNDFTYRKSLNIPEAFLNKLGHIFVHCDKEDDTKGIITILNYLKGKKIPENMKASLYSRLERQLENTKEDDSVPELKSILKCLLFHCVFCHRPEFPTLLIDKAVSTADTNLAGLISRVFFWHRHLFTDAAILKLSELAESFNNDDDDNKLFQVFQILSNYKKIPTELLDKAACFLRSGKLSQFPKQISRRYTMYTLLQNQENLPNAVLLNMLDIKNWYSEDYYAKYAYKIFLAVSVTKILETLTESNWKNIFDHIICHMIKWKPMALPIIQVMDVKNKLELIIPNENDSQELKHVEPCYVIDKISELSNQVIRSDPLTLFFKFHSKQESLLHIQKLPMDFEIQIMDLLIYTNHLRKYIKLHLYKENPSKEDFDILFDKIQTRLQNYDFLHLDLRDNHLKDENIFFLKECLRNSKKKISTLILSNNQITCGKDGLRSLLNNTFCNIIGLKYLYLDRNNIYLTQEDFDTVLRKSNSLLADSGLEILDLSGNFIPKGRLGPYSDNILAPRHILLTNGSSELDLQRNVRFIKSSSILNSCEVADESFSFTPIHNQFYYLKPDLEYPRRISKSVGCIILAYVKSSFLSKHAFFGIDWVPPDQCDNFGQRQLIKSELVINRDDKSLIRIKILQIPPTKFVEDFSAENVEIRGVIFPTKEEIRNFLNAIYRSRDSANIYEYKLLASSSSSSRGQFNCITWTDKMLQHCGITLDTMQASFHL